MARKRAHGEGTIFQRKDGRWQGAITIGFDSNGRQLRKTVYGRSQGEVRRKIEELKRQVDSGTFTTTRHTVKSYFDSWLQHKALEVKPRTLAYYSYYSEKYIQPRIGGLPLANVTTPHVRNLLIEVHESVSSDAANKVRGIVLGSFRQAVRDGLIPRNPAEPIKRFKVDNATPDRIWTPEEAVEFLNTARTHRLFAAFYLAMSTGMRHGEVLGLRWQDIEHDTIHVRQSIVLIRGGQMHLSTPKTSAGMRRIAIDGETLAVLETRRALQNEERSALGEAWGPASEEYADLVFTSETGGPVHPRNFDRVWYALQKKSGVRRIRFHDLRHTHVSLLNKAGLDARTISDRLGHTDPAFTLKRYAHVFESQRRAAAIPLLKLLSDHDGQSN